jgi:nucleoside-diphosphate-sugar epimerase
MKILITGINGYIGKSLYSALKDKYEITTITKNDCDLTNPSKVNLYFSDKWFDVIIHCAVKGGSRLTPDTWNVTDTNISMYYNLLNCKNKFGKLIHFGSGAELYMNDQPYGFSKHVIRQSILHQNNFYNLRIFAVFDENELNTRFIKTNIKNYINKVPIKIYQDKKMDFIYMPDLIKIVEYYIIENNPPKEINCNYIDTFSLKEIADIINNLDYHKVKIELDQKNFGDNYSGNYIDLKIKFTHLKQGIKEVYNKLLNK